MRVVILGAGGHALVVADILLASASSGDLQPVGLLDDDPAQHGRSLLRLPVLGDMARLSDVSHDAIIVAIGDNRARRRVTERVLEAGERLVSAIHPAAIIGSEVTIESGVVVCAGAIVNPGARLGRGAILNTASSVDHHGDVGPYAHLAPGVHTGGNVRIGCGAFVGVGASIIPGRRVGDWAVVGAGATVIHDVPPHTTVVGVPARPIHSAKGVS